MSTLRKLTPPNHGITIVAGEHPNWEEYRAAMQRERRVLLRVRIDRAGPNRQG